MKEQWPWHETHNSTKGQNISKPNICGFGKVSKRENSESKESEAQNKPLI
jgi:hypothetical protein